MNKRLIWGGFILNVAVLDMAIAEQEYEKVFQQVRFFSDKKGKGSLN